MLLLPNGPAALSGKEEILRQYERTDSRLAKYRLPDHDALKDYAARMGSPMHSHELIRRVVRCNPGVWAEASKNNFHMNEDNHVQVMGFYRMKGADKQFLGAFDAGWLPEFSFINTDAADLATEEKRGWRTVIARLLQQGAITHASIRKVFGEPAQNSTARRWYGITNKLRG